MQSHRGLSLLRVCLVFPCAYGIFFHLPQQCCTLVPPFFALYPHFCISQHLVVLAYNQRASRDEANAGNCAQQNMLKMEAGWHLHKLLQAAQMHEEHDAALSATLPTAAQPQSSPISGPTPSPPSYFPPFSWECVFLTLKSAQMQQVWSTCWCWFLRK